MNGTAELDIPNLTRLDEVGANLLPMLNALREKEPIIWNPTVHAWMLLRHEDVYAAYQGKFPLSSEALNRNTLSVVPLEEQDRRIPNIVSRVPKWVVNADPPYHRRVRTVMMKGFTPRIIEAMRPFVRTIVTEVLDRVAARPECDFVEEVMSEVTVRTIMQLVGIPAVELANMKRWSEAITDSFTRPFFTVETLERSEQAFEEMRMVLVREIAERRGKPRDDFLTHLVNAAAEGGAMTEDDLVSQLIFLLPAGHDSTTNTMILGLVALIRNHQMWDYFLNTPERLSENIIELMRYVAMSATSNRIATEDFELHGKKIKKGDFLLLLIASANRDPRVFPDPETLNPGRANETQLVFGSGAHHCMGHLLAKMEISELLPAVMQRFPKIALKDDKLDFSTALAFRGLNHLWVYPNGQPGAVHKAALCKTALFQK